MQETNQSIKSGWKVIWPGVVIGLFVGFGLSQLTIVAKVVETSRDLNYVQERMRDSTNQNDRRFGEMMELVNTTLRQNTDFIFLLREQNALTRQMLEQRKQ